MITTEQDQLEQLNRDYIDAIQHSDIERFEQLLAADFRCSNPDGSIVDRAGFLEQTAKPVTIRGLTTEEVEIRIFADCAIIHAITVYTDGQGESKKGRYTDVWSKHGGAWLAVSAHVTRG